MTDWEEIKCEEDIIQLMETYGGFHDSCIVSLNYTSGAYVDDNSAMYFQGPNERVLSVIFHSQWKPKTVELCFTGVRRMHIVGWQDNNSCDIFDAHLGFYEGILPGAPEKLIVWADYEEFDPAEIEAPLHEPGDTYIIATDLKWRIVE